MLTLPSTTRSGPLAHDEKYAAAKAARERYRFRLERLERNKREKAEKLYKKEKAAGTPDTAPTPDAQTLIQAALERAKAQAATVKPQNIEQLTSAQQAQITEIEARRAKAHELEHPNITPPKE